MSHSPLEFTHQVTPANRQRNIHPTQGESLPGISLDSSRKAIRNLTMNIAQNARSRKPWGTRLFITATRSVIHRITQTQYSQQKSLLVDRLLVLAEGDRHV
jgi:hypothetical protein